MPHRRLSRTFVCLLVLALALPLAMGDGTFTTTQRRPSALVPVAGAAEIRTVPEHAAPDHEVLVGEVGCFQSPFGPEAQIVFRVNGTIRLEQGDSGNLISTILEAPEDPCPAVRQGATATVHELGCVSGPAGNSNIKFVCHDRRENLVAVMAAVSEGVLTGF